MKNGIANEKKTAISNSTEIIGHITAKEHLIINGTVKGNIQIENYNLIIGPSGKVEGDVKAHNVKVRGHLRGEINAKGTVEITKEANFSGNIRSEGISVEEGAYFDASVKLGRGSQKPEIKQKTSSKKSNTEIS